MTIKDLLHKVLEAKASDLHLTVGAPPTLRVDGQLTPVVGTEVLTSDTAKNLVFELLSEEQKEVFLANKELDFSYSLPDIKARFRVNAFFQRGEISAALRHIPLQVPSLEELNLPPILADFCKLPQGFILVTGPTGHGKSTTVAAMIRQINETRKVHIVTIEDPIEYIFSHQKSLIEQRELHLDTHSWEIALRSALREDPDVVFIGEMRDFETISAAVTIAETGHLVLATLHTNSAAQTIDRIIDVFPEHQQQQIRIQLAATIEGIVAQRLVPAIGGGRVPACEILLATAAVRNIIRERKTHQIDNVITTSVDLGMASLERSLAELVKAGKVSLEEAQMHTLRPQELKRLVK